MKTESEEALQYLFVQRSSLISTSPASSLMLNQASQPYLGPRFGGIFLPFRAKNFFLLG
jgi:hypothetical protein